jgi:predicted phage terminase large subunit-like protein
MDMTDAERVANKVLATEDLYYFTRHMFKARRGYKWHKAKHHKIICDALMRVFNGETKRLIITIPPRYSKTEIAIINFIAWSLGKFPDSEFIHASYSATLATLNAWQIRELLQHEAYQDIFPGVQLRDDSKAKAEWKTTAGGSMHAVGSGGTITGFGAGKLRAGFGGAIMLDDLHKADEASSDVIRKGVLEWFQNTIESRKNSPETPIVLIMQRLHEEDIAGWLLNGGNGEHWEHVNLPAIQDDGSALWPEKHDISELRRMEQASPYVFAGQYLQRPSPPSGGAFKPDQIQIVEAVPAGHIRWVRGWDLAATTDGDYSVGAKLGRMNDGRYIIADMVRLRAASDERDAAILNTAKRDGASIKISIPQDPGQAGKTQALYLTRSLSGYTVHTSPESGDKLTRANPFASQVNVGNVMMLRSSWNDWLIGEMRMFPNGSFDDGIDALSRAFAQLQDQGSIVQSIGARQNILGASNGRPTLR